MRKYGMLIAAVVLIVSFTGCTKNTTTVKEPETLGTSTTEETTTEEPTTKELSVEEKRAEQKVNPDIPLMKLYRRDGGYSIFNKVTEYQNEWVYYNDIGGFYTFATDSEPFPYSGFTDKWFEWWNSYSLHDKAKVGYEVIVTLNDGTKLIATIKSPKDTEQIFEYVELYLYDDVHQKPGAWYSHLLENQMTADTFMTSIKVTTGKKIEEVAKIHLTVFTYTMDTDFDSATGRYIGGNYTELEIGKK